MSLIYPQNNRHRIIDASVNKLEGEAEIPANAKLFKRKVGKSHKIRRVCPEPQNLVKAQNEIMSSPAKKVATFVKPVPMSRDPWSVFAVTSSRLVHVDYNCNDDGRSHLQSAFDADGNALTLKPAEDDMDNNINYCYSDAFEDRVIGYSSEVTNKTMMPASPDAGKATRGLNNTVGLAVNFDVDYFSLSAAPNSNSSSDNFNTNLLGSGEDTMPGTKYSEPSLSCKSFSDME
jgi:hypothetical protein